MTGSGIASSDRHLARLLNRRLRDVVPPVDVTPLEVTVIYTFFGFLALYFSDVFLPQAIENAGLLRQVQALKGGVEVVLTAGLIFLLTRRSRLAINRQYERLDTLQAERSVLHRLFRHNLRQDVNLIDGYNELVRDCVAGDDPEHYCETIAETTGRISRYVEDARLIESVLDPALELHELDLSTVVRENARLAQASQSERTSVAIDAPDVVHVVGHQFVNAAFREIVENALIHNDADVPMVKVRVSVVSRDLVELVVADNGPGVPRDERAALASMEEGQLTHSSGLGLWFAKLACTVAGGELEIRDRAGGGTEVAMQLPRASHQTVRRRLSTLLD